MDIFVACYRTCTLNVDMRSFMIAYSIKGPNPNYIEKKLTSFMTLRGEGV